MILFPTPRNRRMVAAMSGLPRHKGIFAAADAAVDLITSDPNWQADFEAALAAPHFDPAVAQNLRVALAANNRAVDAACLAYNRASMKGLNMTTAEAALDAAGDASECDPQGRTQSEQAAELLALPITEPNLAERMVALTEALNVATAAYLAAARVARATRPSL
jgi:hypothetical protein